MRPAILQTRLAPASCEERLLRPGRGDEFAVWRSRAGEVCVRRNGAYDWSTWGRFFRVALCAYDGGTRIQVRGDMILPLKAFAVLWLGGYP